MRRKTKQKTSGKVKIDRQSMVVLIFFALVIVGIIAYQVYNTTPPSAWVSNTEQLPNNRVCMVNNTYMGVEQIEVPIGGKIYYGCCENCVTTLSQKPESRYAIDPYSGEEVDKANAFIYLNPNSKYGEVMYFKSHENFLAFRVGKN